MMNKLFKVIAPVIVLIVLVGLMFGELVPPRSLTFGRMLVTKRRIIQFARLHHKLPSDLAGLPEMPGYDNGTTDAWKRPLDYSFDGSGVVTLQSFGADKQPGGDGDKRDIIGVFESRDAQGNWQDELAEWKEDPLKP